MTTLIVGLVTPTKPSISICSKQTKKKFKWWAENTQIYHITKVLCQATNVTSHWKMCEIECPRESKYDDLSPRHQDVSKVLSNLLFKCTKRIDRQLHNISIYLYCCYRCIRKLCMDFILQSCVLTQRSNAYEEDISIRIKTIESWTIEHGFSFLLKFISILKHNFIFGCFST